MRRRRLRVRFERFLKRLDRALIIHRVDFALAEHEMRLLFIVRPSLAGRAAAQRDGEQDGGRAKRKSKPESHGVKLNEPSGPRNRGLAGGAARARNGRPKTGLRFAVARRKLRPRARGGMADTPDLGFDFGHFPSFLLIA